MGHVLEYSTPAIEGRALDVQRQLDERGQRRAPSISDLLIATTAEINNRVVLHLDKDFDLIAAITGEPLERLVT
jgi:predicted nucleic acid-binding protein